MLREDSALLPSFSLFRWFWNGVLPSFTGFIVTLIATLTGFYRVFSMEFPFFLRFFFTEFMET